MCYFASPPEDLRDFWESLSACEAVNATLSSQINAEEMHFMNNYMYVKLTRRLMFQG